MQTDKNLKRYVATFTVHVYDKNDKKAFIQARKMARKIDTKFGGNCELEQLAEQPFGTIGSREIDVQQLKMDL